MGVQAWRLWGAAVFVLLAGVAGTSWAKSDELSALNDQVERLYQAGEYSEAVPIAQQALAVAEKLHGPTGDLDTPSRFSCSQALQSSWVEQSPTWSRNGLKRLLVSCSSFLA